MAFRRVSKVIDRDVVFFYRNLKLDVGKIGRLCNILWTNLPLGDSLERLYLMIYKVNVSTATGNEDVYPLCRHIGDTSLLPSDPSIYPYKYS